MASTRTSARRSGKTRPAPPAPTMGITKAELDRRTPGLWSYLESAHGFRERDLAKLARPRWLSPPLPTAARQTRGLRFDVGEVDRFLRFCRKLRHIKGRRFGGRPFMPDLWQIVWVIGPVFGWRDRDGLRVVRELYLEVPRKNGKSTLCAAIALYLLCADREPGAEIYSAARDTEQARAVFNVAAKMAKRSPALRRRLKALIPSRVIRFDATDSEYKALSSDKEGLSKHGLNVHACIVDELHVIKDAELISTLETGTGSRDQPLIVFITTAGIPDDSPVWRDKRSLAEKVANRAIVRHELAVVIFAADPKCETDGTWRNPKVWASCNPGLGTSLRPDYLAGKAAAAEVSARELSTFLRLHLDVPTGAATGWIALPTWDRSASIVDDSDLVGCECYGGLDLASSLDLCALIWAFPDEADEYVDVIARFWTPAETLRQRAHRDQADYEAWVKAGVLKTTPGETIDYDAIERDVIRDLDRFDVQSLDYDPWGSKQLRTHLEDGGAPIIECRQGFASLSPPMKETERLVVKRRLRHGGHPVLRFCVGNTIAVQDPAGNVKPDRKRSRGRIDGSVGLIMAIGGWQRSLAAGTSAYDDHGLEVTG